jgi:GTP-binding protein
VNTFVLIDSRIPPQRIDLEFISFLGRNGIPLAIVFTKVDKQNQSETARNVNAFKNVLLEEWEELPPMFLTSSLTGYGREALLDSIEQINEELRTNKQ